MFRRLVVAAAALPIALTSCVESRAQRADSNGAATARRLAARVEIDWSGNALRTSLMRLGEVQQVSLFLDRRIDPDQPVEFHQSKPLPLGRVLEQVARRTDAAIVPIGPVLYLAPRSAASRLAARIEQLESESSRVRHSVTRTRLRIKWPLGSRPRDIAVGVAKRFGLRLSNPEAIPHDVWPSYNLPPVTLQEALTLILAGFDLAWKLDDTESLSVVPLSRAPKAAAHYLFAPSKPPLLREVRKRFPSLTWKRQGAWYIVNGTESQIGAAEQWFTRLDEGEAVRRASANRRERYTLAVQQQPVGAILKTLENKGWHIEVDEAAREALHHRVSFDVKRVSLERLLEKTLGPAGLRFELENDTIVVSEKMD